MEIFHTIAELREKLDSHRSGGDTIGYVPTMGALHDGHRSLLTAAAHDTIGVASIFVNPLQFAPNEDLHSYPRTLETDAAMAESVGMKYLFVPSVREMYPEENLTAVTIRTITDQWEGVSRPAHFDGVATVVTKLFNIVGPCLAFFGEKDFQQLAMIRRMVLDLNQPIEVIGLPTIREEDGLAMSSRNRRLTAEHRAQASVVNRALRRGIEAIEHHERDPAAIEAIIRAVIATAPDAEAPDYIAVVDSRTLRTPDVLEGSIRLLTAVRFGDVRLIDNMGVTIP